MADEGERVGLDADELPRAKDSYRYMADRRLLERVARMERQASRMVRDPNLPIRAGVLPFHLEPSDWRTGFLSVYEIDLPPELFGDLKECAPQALLRDLFRPEREAFVWYDREVLVTLDRGGTQALRDALAAQKLDPVPVVKPLVHEVKQRADAWRQVLSQRWLPILDDNEPRKKVFTIHEPALNW